MMRTRDDAGDQRLVIRDFEANREQQLLVRDEKKDFFDEKSRFVLDSRYFDDLRTSSCPATDDDTSRRLHAVLDDEWLLL